MSSFEFNANSHTTSRKRFLCNMVKLTGAFTLMNTPLLSSANAFFPPNKDYTVQDIMDIILKEIPGAPFTQTVDTLKSGTAQQQVTGVVTTMFPTVEVINKAIALKANFIVAHEPTFYNHTDDLNWVPNNSVAKKKMDLLQQNNIAVWRFHDYWHTHRPDGVSYGVAKNAGWLPYYKTGEAMLTIPVISLKQLVQHLQSSLGIEHLRVVGDLSQQCSRIALAPGAAPGQTHVKLVEEKKPDVLIVGELREWETAEYIRDARAFGSKTSLIILGHAVSEEPGMEYLVQWLQPKLAGIKVTHLPSKNPFIWI